MLNLPCRQGRAGLASMKAHCGRWSCYKSSFEGSAMNRFIEIRFYKLKPGSGTSFDALMRNETVPLLRAAKMDVVS